MKTALHFPFMPSKVIILFISVILSAYTLTAAPKPKDNTLSAKEKKAGWKLLFDGNTMNGWREAYMEALPRKGWEVKDGMLCVRESGGGEAAFGGDIVTLDDYSSFELTLDVKLTEGANSGIKYFVIEQLPKTPGSAKGLEYQLLDDEKHPDANLGINGNRTLASLYDIMPASKNKKAKPIGDWNHVRLVVKGKQVEHWLNGIKVLEFQRGDGEFLKHKAESKFKDIPGFGEYEKGRILLQDHGNQVFFKNIKVRTF